MKITIKVTPFGDPDEGKVEVAVLADGKQIAEGRIGGEPEDNSIGRDYAWATATTALERQ